MPRSRSLVSASAAAHFQPHIQGLRAVAVLLVMLYHFWPGRISGGYVGVDVFFVISGFLITGQLARELERSGRIRLPSFWAKRARRLLPASITVLIFCSLATVFLLPLSSLFNSVKEILASTFYLENWQLALSSVDYLAVHDATTVQHYWSLSLEEQFYLVWPLLLLGAAWLGVRFFARRRWLPLVGVVVLVSALSLIASVLYTQNNAAEAYFVTFTRMWEFGAGAILALMPRWRPSGVWWPNLIGYAGLISIAGAGYFFTDQTEFPGYMALIPVLGAAAVIACNRSEHWWDIGRVLGGRPQRFVGDISYSLYLWHWPLIIVAPYIAGWGVQTWNQVVLFLFCFVLAWLTKIFVEDPTRNWKFLTVRKASVTAACTVGLMVFSSLFVGGAWAVANPKYEAAAAQLKRTDVNPPACFGAAASPACQNPGLAAQIIPNPGFGNTDVPDHAECFVTLDVSTLTACHFGSKVADAPRVALIGDSHAYQFIDPMIRLAEKNGWALTTYLKGNCPWNSVPVDGPTALLAGSCAGWRANLSSELATATPYAAIFTAGLWDTPYVTGSSDPGQEIAEGYVDAWAQARGAHIVAIVDNPDFKVDPNNCLRFRSAASCTKPRQDVLPATSPVRLAAAEVAKIGGGGGAGISASTGPVAGSVTVLDFTDKYCDDVKCFSVIGGVDVYRNKNHLTNTWALTMTDFIGDAVKRAISG